MSKKNTYKKILKSIKNFLYGMSGFNTANFALVTKGNLEYLFILLIMGNILGVPILFSYYSIRLLPFIVPKISMWKKYMLHKKDLIDLII